MKTAFNFTSAQLDSRISFSRATPAANPASYVEITENEFSNVSVNLTRPKDVTVCSNRFINGNINIIYSFTSPGVGRNHVAFNYMTAKSVIANPFVVTTGGGFSTLDFLGNDQYKYNTFVGYTSGASIAAGMAGAYDGSFS